MRILVVDDQAPNRGLLSYILEDDGHEVIEAIDGASGVDQFRSAAPDLVLMDVAMPGMDGYEAAQTMKANSDDRHVPIIFLTAHSDEASLSRCLEVGGDDFLTKPINETLLNAKIKAHQRIRELNDELKNKNVELTELHRHQKDELVLARHVFEVALGQNVISERLRAYIAPMTGFSGDMILTADAPNGELMAMLGDFTGHGLPAALGALPVSQLFHDLSVRGESVENIARLLNASLARYLPGNMFCAATIMEIPRDGGPARVWAGGLPDLLVASADGAIRARLESGHMPLGILGAGEFDAATQTLELGRGERAFVYSDGICDCTNPAGEMFGEARLEALFDGATSGSELFDRILTSSRRYMDGHPQDDDISLLEIAGS